jgi:CHAD domain-containing protein
MALASEHVRRVFRKMEREVLRLSSDRQAEAVHSFRTTSRRLETLLTGLVAGRDRNQKKLLKMLGRIRRRAGRVRDLDVQLAALRSLKVPIEPRRKTQLMQRLLELRAQQETKLGKLLKKTGLRELRKRLKRASTTLKLKAGRDPLAVAREILSKVSITSDPVNDELLHRYRLAVKRARYAAEFAARSTEASQFISELKQLQDALGNWHDWHTLTQTASEHLGELNQSSLVAALHNVTRGKFRQASTALSAARKASAGPLSGPPLLRTAKTPTSVIRTKAA